MNPQHVFCLSRHLAPDANQGTIPSAKYYDLSNMQKRSTPKPETHVKSRIVVLTVGLFLLFGIVLFLVIINFKSNILTSRISEREQEKGVKEKKRRKKKRKKDITDLIQE